MAATIEMKLKDNSKEWVDELKKRFKGGGVAAKDLEKHLEALNKELDSRAVKEHAKQLQELADELDGTTQRANELSDAQGRLHSEIINNSRAMQELDEAAYEAAKRAGRLADYNRDLANALDERRVSNYRAQINKLADEMSGLGKNTSRTAAIMSEFAAAGKGAMAPVSAALSAMKVSWEGIQMAIGAVNAMAERGNPAARGLIEAFSDLQEALLDIGEDPSIQNWLSDITVGITHGLIPALEDATWMFSGLAEAGSSAMQNCLILMGDVYEYLGLVDKGAANAMRTMIKFRNEIQGGMKAAIAATNAERAAQREKEKEEKAAALINPIAKMREEQAKKDRLEAIKGSAGEVQLQGEINKLLAAQAILVAEIKAQGGDPSTDKRVLQNVKDLTDLEIRRVQLLKEWQDKQKAKEKELTDLKSASDKKAFDDEIKYIDTLLRESTQSADKIKELEQRRMTLVKENKDRERKLLIETGQLEQHLLEEDLNRIAVRAQKERDAVLAGLAGEQALYLAREKRRDLERAAEQEKVDKFKEFITGGIGGGPLGMGGAGVAQMGGGGCACDGMPMGGMGGGPQMPMNGGGGWGGRPIGGGFPNGGWNGPNAPMPVGWHGQTPWPGGGPKPRPDPIGMLTGGIKPRDVWNRTVKNAQDEAERRRIEEGRANGTLDQDGNPIDFKAEEDRQARKLARQKLAQGMKAAGVDIGPQQILGDAPEVREGWNDPGVSAGDDARALHLRLPNGELDRDPAGDPVLNSSPHGQAMLREAQAAQFKRQKEEEAARKEAEAARYKKLMDLNKQEEEQKRKQKVAEETLKQGQADKAANLPELTAAKEEADLQLAETQKAQYAELQRVKAEEDRRRNESIAASRESKRQREAERSEESMLAEAKAEWDRRILKDEDKADRRKIAADKAAGGDGTGLDLNRDRRKRAEEEREKKAREELEKRRAQERKYSPNYGGETARDRAEARRRATARGQTATRRTRATARTQKLADARKGKISGPETTRAYHDLVQEQMGQLKSQGRLDSTQTQAIEQLLQATRDGAQLTAEMQEKMDQLLQQILELRGARPSKSRNQSRY